MSTDEIHTCPVAGAVYRAHQRHNHRQATAATCHLTKRMEQTYSLDELQGIIAQKLGRPCPLAAISYLSMADGRESIRELATGMHVTQYCVRKHERDIRVTLIPLLRAMDKDFARTGTHLAD